MGYRTDYENSKSKRRGCMAPPAARTVAIRCVFVKATTGGGASINSSGLWIDK